jgi:D-tyrosyl-tRNA(Tyr) deacylase
MKVVLQRTMEASVSIDQEVHGQIDFGYVIFIGISQEDAQDTQQKIDFLVNKLLRLRLFEDQHGKMNFSLTDIGGEILAISQFTLYADCRKGTRPSFTEAMAPSEAEAIYNQFIATLQDKYDPAKIKTGEFGAYMQVQLQNDGPVTITLEK